jgi:Protein of unknown function (DUF2950)
VGRAIENKHGFTIPLMAIVALMAAVAVAPPVMAQSAGQETFKTPEAAADALVLAAKTRDKAMALKVLGAKSEGLFNTGEPDVDVSQHQLFVNKYQQMHRLVSVGKQTKILYVGAENWPLPVPIKKGKSGWYFDSKGARAEILARRIGSDELSAINTCLAIVQAQNDYKAQTHDGDTVKQYAQRLASTDGKHDGLYWSAEGTQPKSPVGPRLALASYQGGASPPAESKPYYGYYFKILTAQGKEAPGGAQDYLENGKLTKGFALVAYPAKYRVSGVTTFIVNQDGAVLQKDLGPATEKIATSMQQFNPDSSWVVAN